ncbi:MAG TPA: cbb3-type cytochrome c oxidase subunit I, partial [Gemmatimonadaceae bacterium]|nr:cbb3-type cytochrome c oxidase subunit I [Gemmatimonadaceae bacterium]
HFWLATIGIVLYTVALWAAGLMEGLSWRALDPAGQLKYASFVETVAQLQPFYWMRLVGGTMYLVGTVMMGINFILTARSAGRPSPDALPAAA